MLTGSYDAGDPLTTNVHVSNLPMSINEHALGMMFAEYGPVGSVKVKTVIPVNYSIVRSQGARYHRSCGQGMTDLVQLLRLQMSEEC